VKILRLRGGFPIKWKKRGRLHKGEEGQLVLPVKKKKRCLRKEINKGLHDPYLASGFSLKGNAATDKKPRKKKKDTTA